MDAYAPRAPVPRAIRRATTASVPTWAAAAGTMPNALGLTAAIVLLLPASAAAETSFNCSYNGALAADGSSSCTCGSGWTGQFCEQLDLLPARNGSGLDQLHASPFISTWGGSVLYDNATELYHMYASEM